MTDLGRKYLFDILRSIELIEKFLTSVPDYHAYTADLKTQSAVERQLGIMGEAVQKFDRQFPELTLNRTRKIVGLRNRLIHAYDSVDLSIVWAIISNHLIPLKEEEEDKINQ